METKHIIWIIVGSFVMLVLISFVSTYNTAVGYEENIEQSISGIQVQQQRQKSLILQLVQVVEQASQFESETQTQIAQLRTEASSGNVEQAQILINAVAEAYPTLQANQTYVNLMNEMSVSENLVTSYRTTYNEDVRNYNRFVRRFPSNAILGMTGYDVRSYPFLEFDDTELPINLFED